MTEPNISLNSHFQLAADFIRYTAQHVFLTGKAGTGKTTFLKYIRENCAKNTVVTAPTGVAAVNCGGVTLHSLFQLPIGTYIPAMTTAFQAAGNQVIDKHSLFRNLRLGREKIKLFNSLELLIIDEVSMLRADALDAVDAILRRVRKNFHTPFGGLQVLFIGDLFQLPPVVKEAEWALLQPYYTTPFFYDALVLQQEPPVCIELEKIYRQTDDLFIGLLNRVRGNEATDEDFATLRQFYRPGFNVPPGEHYITLTTHNKSADEINRHELEKLPYPAIAFEAAVSGDFPERMYPVEKSLILKEGAQVMFIKNDKDKRYFNGRIGVVGSIQQVPEEDPVIEVHFPGTAEVIIVKQEIWKNIRYSLNEQDNKIEETETGNFTHYPLRLAWAITIHKSQGLTFQKAVIDAGQAFAAGQVYVALSRCVSLDGIVLRSAITETAVHTDSRIVAYMKTTAMADRLPALLQVRKEQYTISKIKAFYNLQELEEQATAMVQFLGNQKTEIKEDIIENARKIHEGVKQVKTFADRFILEIIKLTADGLTPAVADHLKDRQAKANLYFEKQLLEKVVRPVATVNAQLQKDYKSRLIFRTMSDYTDGFHLLLKKFGDGTAKHNVPVIVPGTHKGLLDVLKAARTVLANNEELPAYRICSNSTLEEMARYIPQSLMDMAQLKGMGNYTLNKYGEIFLQKIIAYATEHQLAGNMHARKSHTDSSAGKSGKKIDTKRQSLDLFESGISCADIATQRNLSPGTIESHLAHFVQEGKLDVYRLVSREKYCIIADAIAQATVPGLTAIKDVLGSEASYAEIRFVVSDLAREKSMHAQG